MSDIPEGAETAADAEALLKSLKGSRRGKLGSCTRKMNEIKALLVEGGNVDIVEESVETFNQAVNDFKTVHRSVQRLLSEEEGEEDHVDWYEPRITNLQILSKYLEKEVELWKSEQMAQSIINPLDSISNVSQKSKGSKAQSSVSSACKRAAAEKAALLARAAALKEKHALKRQETELKAKLEQMELDTVGNCSISC